MSLSELFRKSAQPHTKSSFDPSRRRLLKNIPGYIATAEMAIESIPRVVTSIAIGALGTLAAACEAGAITPPETSAEKKAIVEETNKIYGPPTKPFIYNLLAKAGERFLNNINPNTRQYELACIQSVEDAIVNGVIPYPTDGSVPNVKNGSVIHKGPSNQSVTRVSLQPGINAPHETEGPNNDILVYSVGKTVVTSITESYPMQNGIMIAKSNIDMSGAPRLVTADPIPIGPEQTLIGGAKYALPGGNDINYLNGMVLSEQNLALGADGKPVDSTPQPVIAPGSRFFQKALMKMAQFTSDWIGEGDESLTISLGNTLKFIKDPVDKTTVPSLPDAKARIAAHLQLQRTEDMQDPLQVFLNAKGITEAELPELVAIYEKIKTGFSATSTSDKATKYFADNSTNKLSGLFEGIAAMRKVRTDYGYIKTVDGAKAVIQTTLNQLNQVSQGNFSTGIGDNLLSTEHDAVILTPTTTTPEIRAFMDYVDQSTVTVPRSCPRLILVESKQKVDQNSSGAASVEILNRRQLVMIEPGGKSTVVASFDSNSGDYKFDASAPQIGSGGTNGQAVMESEGFTMPFPGSPENGYEALAYQEIRTNPQLFFVPGSKELKWGVYVGVNDPKLSNARQILFLEKDAKMQPEYTLENSLTFNYAKKTTPIPQEQWQAWMKEGVYELTAGLQTPTELVTRAFNGALMLPQDSAVQRKLLNDYYIEGKELPPVSGFVTQDLHPMTIDSGSSQPYSGIIEKAVFHKGDFIRIKEIRLVEDAAGNYHPVVFLDPEYRTAFFTHGLVSQEATGWAIDADKVAITNSPINFELAKTIIGLIPWGFGALKVGQAAGAGPAITKILGALLAK